jgi:hypothetical protein
MKMWMFENWVADQADDAELAKNHAYLLGSFWNPEAVKKILGQDSGGYSSSDEDFEKSTEMVRKMNTVNIVEKDDGNKRKRRRKIKV